MLQPAVADRISTDATVLDMQLQLWGPPDDARQTSASLLQWLVSERVHMLSGPARPLGPYTVEDYLHADFLVSTTAGQILQHVLHYWS